MLNDRGMDEFRVTKDGRRGETNRWVVMQARRSGAWIAISEPMPRRNMIDSLETRLGLRSAD